MSTDRILTVNEYYDGPRLGIAEFGGVPHVYEAEFDHSTDEYGDTYFLSPVQPELWRWCWKTGKSGFAGKRLTSTGDADLCSHPALPAERARHEELERLIGSRLKTDPAQRLYCKAEFTVTAPGSLMVQWKQK
jgi:hypothetical protein